MGIHLEGPFFSPALPGIHPPGAIRNPDLGLTQRLLDAGPISFLTLAPELPGALELIRWLALTWPFEVAVLLLPTGMISVINGSIDDGYNGILGWMWVACAVFTIALVGVTRAALKERQYSAVMAATGLLYLAILTAFGTDLVARAVLA